LILLYPIIQLFFRLQFIYINLTRIITICSFNILFTYGFFPSLSFVIVLLACYLLCISRIHIVLLYVSRNGQRLHSLHVITQCGLYFVKWMYSYPFDPHVINGTCSVIWMSMYQKLKILNSCNNILILFLKNLL